MKKIFAASFAMLAVTASAMAAGQNSSTAWSCYSKPFSNFSYCGTTITSSTTSAALGSVDVDPTKTQYLSLTASNSAISGLVTPTITLYLDGAVVSQQNVSATTSGNIVNLGSVPYFNNVVVSFSTPATISATNSVRATVIENK